MGIGCRRDPLEANVWYVKAADQGDERARQRIAAIRAAASGAHPHAGGKKGKKSKAGEPAGKSSVSLTEDEQLLIDKKVDPKAGNKRFVIF